MRWKRGKERELDKKIGLRGEKGKSQVGLAGELEW